VRLGMTVHWPIAAFPKRFRMRIMERSVHNLGNHLTNVEANRLSGPSVSLRQAHHAVPASVFSSGLMVDVTKGRFGMSTQEAVHVLYLECRAGGEYASISRHAAYIVVATQGTEGDWVASWTGPDGSMAVDVARGNDNADALHRLWRSWAPFTHRRTGSARPLTCLPESAPWRAGVCTRMVRAYGVVS